MNNIISLSLNNKTENNEKDNKDNLDKNNEIEINNNINIKTEPIPNFKNINNVNEINDGKNYLNNINNINYSIPKPKTIFLNQKLILHNIDDEENHF